MKTVWINAWKMWKLGMKGEPIWNVAAQLIGILDVLPIVGSIIATAFVFNRAMEIYNGTAEATSITFPLVVFASILILRYIMTVVSNHVFANMFYKMQAYHARIVAEKSARLAPITYEKPQLLDDINKAITAISQAHRGGIAIIGNALMVLTFGLFLGIYLYLLNPLLVLALAFAFVPKMIALAIQTPLYSKLEDKSGPLRREATAYEDAMGDRQFLKETRILGAFDFFQTKYLAVVKLLNVQTWKADAKAASIDLLMSLFTGTGYMAIIYLLFHSLSSGAISIGEFAAVFGGVATWVFYIVDNMVMIVDQSTRNIGGVSAFLNFLELPEMAFGEVPVNFAGDIQLKNVDFTYPNANHPSLRNLNLTIKAGETIAIVGENGAGKSTLTKLLMGLYQPTKGEVLVDGTKNLGGSYKGVSVVFQKFQRYQLDLTANIKLSDIATDKKLATLMEQAGVDIHSESYPQGVDTILSREFDGVDLSGGQWQRVAIARGLYRHHDLIILDEPTAAIDPIEESRLYEKFAEIATDKTAIIVTHRLGSAKIADRIIVMDNGEIVETGSHQELLGADGLYAKMYGAQESWYMSA